MFLIVPNLQATALKVACMKRRLEPPTGAAALFCGDSLFVGGCGRNFEGTPEELHSCLMEQFATLRPDTAVYCGHEYTLSNLQFAVRRHLSALDQALAAPARIDLVAAIANVAVDRT